MSLDYSKYENTKPFPNKRTPDNERMGMRRAYDDEMIRLELQFWKDLCVEYDITPEHPKYVLLSSMAWEYGHSAGLQEVEYYFSEFIDLVR